MTTSYTNAIGGFNPDGTLNVAPAVNANEALQRGQALNAAPCYGSAAVTGTTITTTTNTFVAPTNGILVVIASAWGAGGINAISLTSSSGTLVQNGNGGNVGAQNIGYMNLITGASLTLSYAVTQGTSAGLLASIITVFVPSP